MQRKYGTRGTRNLELGTRNSELATRNSQLGTRNSELGTRNSEVKIKVSLLGFGSTRDTFKNTWNFCSKEKRDFRSLTLTFFLF